MPSHFGASRKQAGGDPRSFSRVTSFKRDWDDDQPAAKAQMPSSSASERLEWSPSPERVQRKGVLVAYKDDPPPPPAITFDPAETPADRRRKAILAAFSANVPNPSSNPSSSSSTSIPSVPKKPAPLPHVQKLPAPVPAPQSLPSVPIAGQKRAMPWMQDMESTRKSIQRPSSTSSEASKHSSVSASASVINIRQKIVLSTEQQKVLSLVVAEGKNIFFTGSAGTGKSVLLKEIIKALQKKYATAPDAVAVTASTGIAACNIGGVTLHSFGGVGLGVEAADHLVKKIKMNKKASARWLRTKVLIVDEVSMVDGELFDKLCKIGQMMRKQPSKPFGGMQIIVTGDFFQLPPVTKGGAQPKFCFEAETWKDTIHMSVNLTKVFRQKDQRFVDMLNEMRFGKMTQVSISTFRSLARPLIYDDGIEATELFPRREDVERSNSFRLGQLHTDGWTYNAIDSGSITDITQRNKLLENFMAPKSLALKLNAQVMLIKNMDETLVNGSMGKVIGFCHKQFWDTDTRGRWREDVGLDDLSEEDRAKKEKTRAMLEAKLASSNPLPVVSFKVPGGYRDQLIDFDQFKVELPNGEVQAARSQLPLILAWAMSIHKSQGQTLDRVKVDLSKVFEKGQAYVALSRATSLEGLQVLGFSADKVMAHRKVAQWSTSLRDLNV